MRARDNPFRAERLHRLRFRPQGTTWPALLERLAALDYRGGIIGGEGRGKTAFLLELAERLPAAGLEPRLLRLERGQRRLGVGERQALAAPEPRTLLLVDSGGDLSRRGWRELARLAARAAGLVVTTHRPGPLPTLLACATNADLLERLVADLLPAEERPARGAIERLFARHRGNLRAALAELYDDWARR